MNSDSISDLRARYDLINFYIRNRGYSRYLELGTLLGETFTRVECKDKTGVDNGDYPFIQTHKMTTAEFFNLTIEKFDIIFIDACHQEDFVRHDIRRSLDILTPGGVILCHDCSPPCQKYEGDAHCWTAWRAFVRYRATSPHLCQCYYSDYGVGIIDTAQPAPEQQGSLVVPPLALSYDWLDQNRTEALGLVERIDLCST
jgi:hypothetical protein